MYKKAQVYKYTSGFPFQVRDTASSLSGVGIVIIYNRF